MTRPSGLRYPLWSSFFRTLSTPKIIFRKCFCRNIDTRLPFTCRFQASKFGILTFVTHLHAFNHKIACASETQGAIGSKWNFFKLKLCKPIILYRASYRKLSENYLFVLKEFDQRLQNGVSHVLSVLFPANLRPSAFLTKLCDTCKHEFTGPNFCT
jgi:hypothetical protein